MGVLRDLYQIAKSLDSDTTLDDIFDDEGDSVSPVRSVSYDSIAKQAKNGVMQFPMIASRALSFDNIQMVSKASERNFASFLQVIFTMNQVTNTDNPIDFVHQYHQNTNTSVKGPSDALSFVFNNEIPQAMRDKIMKLVKEGNITYGQMFEFTSLNKIMEPMGAKALVGEAYVTEAKGKGKGKGGSGGGGGGNNPPSGGGNNPPSGGTRTTTSSTRTTRHRSSGGGEQRAPYYNPRQHPDQNLPRNIFVDNDVKKANELIPTLMHVRILKQAGYGGEDSKFIDFIVGVKATIHPITSEDMVEHIVSALQERGKLFKLIKWTTGEIAFFKDLLFNVDQIKGEIRDIRTGKSSTWWSALKNTKAKRRLHRWTMRSPVLPNSTLVISMEEADYIKANFGFDLMDDEIGKKLLEAYNLLQLAVVDSAAEVVYTFVDGNDRYELTTFRGLERENGSAERQFKDILRAANKLQ